MTLSELRAAFRGENPEITIAVASDATVNSWLLQGDKDFCTRTRCIIDQAGTKITTAENDTHYDLSAQITNFYDIDEFPGGGVVYNSKRIDKITMGELDKQATNWRTRQAGTPKNYFRRGKWIYLDRPIDANHDDLIVYSVLVSNDFTGDSSIPYNGLTYLYPFHLALILYLKYRGKMQIGKSNDAELALKEYADYCKWVKAELAQSKYGVITMRRNDTAYT